jgi:predicted dehydrogenase
MSAAPRRLRLGMVGGGAGSFIGAVHRMAARLDDEWELVAAALSSDPQRAAQSAAELRIAPERSYARYTDMAEAEAQIRRAGGEGIDAVAIVTPNHLHAPVAHAFLDAGIDVICDKPLALTLEEGLALQAKAEAAGRLFVVTYTYSGYPMVRKARQLVRRGDLGALRLIQVEYAQDWLSTALEHTGHKQAQWRTDPTQAGAAGCLGDIGTHAYQLACFVSGLRVESVSADVAALVAGRALDDHVQASLRFEGGVRGSLWACQAAAGEVNGLRLRIFGEHASLVWSQEQPESLRVRPAAGETVKLLRGRTEHGPTEAIRVPAGHPEGFIEAFAQIYRDAAAAIRYRQAGLPTPAEGADLTTVADGVSGLAFVRAALHSAAQGGRWAEVGLGR